MKTLRTVFCCLICCAQAFSQQASNLSIPELDRISQELIKEKQIEKAIPYLLSKTNKLKAQLPLKDSLYKNSVSQLVHYYQEVQQYQQAENALKEYIELKKKAASDSLDLVDAYQKLGINHHLNKEHLDAGYYYSIALELLEKIEGKNSDLYLEGVSDLIAIYYTGQHFELAEALTKETLAFIKTDQGPQSKAYMELLKTLGLIYRLKGDLEGCLKQAEYLLKIKKEKNGPNSMEYLRWANYVGVLSRKTADYEKAEALFKESITIYQKFFGERNLRYGVLLSNWANMKRDQEDYEAAERLFLEANAIYQETLDPNSVFVIGGEFNLADVYIRAGDYDKAWEKIYKGLHLNNPSVSFEQLSKETFEAFKKEDYYDFTQQKRAFELAYDLLEKEQAAGYKKMQLEVSELMLFYYNQQRTTLIRDEDKLSILRQSTSWMLNKINVIEAPQKAFEIAEAYKSVLLSEAIKTDRNIQFGTLSSKLTEERKLLYKLADDYKARMLASNSSSKEDSFRILFNQTIQGLNANRKLIEETYPDYTNLSFNNSGAPIEKLQASLTEKHAILEFVVGKEWTNVFFITKHDFQKIDLALSRDSLLTRIKIFHKVLSNYKAISSEEAYSSYCRNAYWFYQNLIAPVLAEHQELKHLIIIPDNELGHLPFGSFLTEAGSPENIDYKSLNYLLKSYTISYNYSANLWLNNLNSPKKKNNGLVLAIAANYDTRGSTFENSSATIRNLREQLDALPAAREEVKALGQAYAGQSLFDEMANEADFKENAAEYRIIHLAMHGLLDQEYPLLSSLAFTDNGDLKEDNFLQAHEISKMELNAELVVLSACETGYGRFESGNGIASLARAFMYAGVSSLIVSLWQVNDASTSIIMQNFYKHLADGKSKSAALRQAKLDYLESVDNPIAAHPAFWSPFILIGDESPVKLQPKDGVNWLWWILGSVLLVIGAMGYGMMRRARSSSSISSSQTRTP